MVLAQSTSAVSLISERLVPDQTVTTSTERYSRLVVLIDLPTFLFDGLEPFHQFFHVAVSSFWRHPPLGQLCFMGRYQYRKRHL